MPQNSPHFPIPTRSAASSEDALKLVSQLRSNGETGLSNAEASSRITIFGSNTLPQEKPTPLPLIFLRQFKSPFIYVLLFAAVCSFLLGRDKDGIMICIIILTNGILGTAQEFGAEKKASALKSFLTLNATVRRDSKTMTLDAEQLVPGDIIMLQSGDKVPADIRILHAKDLSVDESILTGESVPVSKSVFGNEEENNILSAGSTVMVGRATGVVFGTGKNTMIGGIANNVSESKRAKPPLLVRMEKFSKLVSAAILGIVLLLAVVSLAKGSSLTDTLFIAIGLAVAAIPEGLPIAVTIALAIGSQRMAKRGVIIKQLAAVEALGSCTLIASDKTGTLTVNKQTVRTAVVIAKERINITGEGYNNEGTIESTSESNSEMQKLAEAVLFSSEASLYKEADEWKYNGDSVDIALLAFAYKAGLSNDTKCQSEILHTIPYESEKRFSATYYSYNNEYHVAMKGALEAILPHCSQMQTSEGLGCIDPMLLEEEATRLAELGFRVIAVAGTSDEEAMNITQDKDILNRNDLIFYGLLGLIDPIHPAAFDAVQRCKKAGIEVAMITGDHPSTALAIAKELHIAQGWDQVMSGKELDELGNKAIPDTVRVFARVSPLQKFRIVEHFKAMGHYVAVTGDGVNDAPALKSAHIGVAMGTATDVAKDAASIVLKNNNFDTIVAGIEEGRIAYDNIRKVIFLLIPTAAALLLLFSLSLFTGMPVVFFPLQLLWINMVTNGVQDVGLAFEKGEKNIMKRMPRSPKENIFDRYMVRGALLSGLVIGLGTFFVWKYLLTHGYREEEARNIVLLLMVIFQNFHVLNARSELCSFFRIPIRNNYMVIGGILLAFVLHFLALYTPFLQDLLGTMPVSPTMFGYIVLLASSILIVMELFKFFYRKKLTSEEFQT